MAAKKKSGAKKKTVKRAGGATKGTPKKSVKKAAPATKTDDTKEH
jgi:hypothetical protein